MIETFKKIWGFCENRKKDLIRALILSFFRSAFGICQIFAIILAIKVITGESDLKLSVIKIVLLTLICIVGNFATSYFEQLYTMRSGFFMIGDKRVSIAGTVRHFPLGFFSENGTGKIAATLTTTLSGVESASVMVMIGIISGLFSSAALFIFMMFYDYRIGIVSGIGTVIYLLLVSYQMKLSRKNAPKLQRAQSKLTEATVNFLSGIKVTKSFSFKSGDRKLKDAIENSKDENIALTKVSMPSQFAAGAVIAVFESAILILTLILYFKVGDIDLVKTVVLLIFSFMVYASLNQAGSMLSMIGLLDAGIDEVEQIEKNPKLETLTPVKVPSSNEIEFQNVSFAYGENEVLHNISLKFRENSLNAIIGPSGSGKTTLCQLIARFRDVSSGKITVGGADVKNIDEQVLMSKISMVFQNVYLFEDSVLNNIRFGKPDATLDEVRTAAKKARCDDFIMGLKDGYDTLIEEGGASLSGGEKQRISIARAILKDAPIVILDEATSALDAENEHEILSAIDVLTQNKTVIMIAHRINTVKNADLIVALKDGRVVQSGTHSELINQKGLYADFLKSRQDAQSWKIGNFEY